MIEQTGSDAVDHHGLAIQSESEHPGESRPLEKITEDRNNQNQKKPRRFSYQSGSTVLEGYTIKRGIGIGGFGEVYFGISDAGKEVALKRVQRNLDVELRGVSQCLNLKHINLISLWDIRQDTEGESWVVMEYVPGESLRDILEKNPNGISVEESRKWFTQILEGVAYLHDHGIVHRDLKPGNIFYDQDENVVKIGDYGLSKFISTSKRDGQTESVGTFHYMAPEIGKGTYGKEIDIYSLGIILCEVLSGRVPFDGESGQEIIMKHLTASPEIDFIEERFQRVIHRALAKDPAHRFSSVQQMLDAIDWDGSAEEMGAPGGSSRAVVDTMFVRQIENSPVQDDDEPLDDESRSREPMYIGDEAENDADEIRFGEMKDAGQNGNSAQQPRGKDGGDWSSSDDGAIRMSNVRQTSAGSQKPKPYGPSVHPVVANQVSQSANQPVVVTTSNRQTEPIAHAVGNGYQKVHHWWNGIGATPIKVLLVVILGLFVLFNAEWLVPLSICLGCVYMVYYLVRTNLTQRQEVSTPAKATAIRPFSKKECMRMVEQKLRETRLSLPFSEKLAESLGAVLTATFVTAISIIVALGFSGFSLNGSIGTMSVFTWLTMTTVLGASACIFMTKQMESNVGNQWKRRFVFMSAGLLIGAASFAIYQSFLIETMRFPEQISSLQDLGWMTQGETGLMRFMTFFAGYFLVIRWWKVGDALRVSQFSVVLMILHTIVAVGLGLLTSFPVIWALIIGSSLSIAVQLSSTWIQSKEREKIQYEVMQSISA